MVRAAALAGESRGRFEGAQPLVFLGLWPRPDRLVAIWQPREGVGQEGGASCVRLAGVGGDPLPVEPWCGRLRGTRRIRPIPDPL